MPSTLNTTPLYLTRFIAAYLVLIYHYFPKTYLRDNAYIDNFSEPVNYFFFISGFVMIVSNQKTFLNEEGVRNFSKMDFWIKRIARIYPLYLLGLLLCVVYHYAVSYSIPSIPSRFTFELLGVQRWLYAGSINYPAWSVSCELFFYFIFPFTLHWLFFTPFNKLFKQVVVLFFASVLLNFLVSFYLLHLDYGKLYKSLINSFYQHPVFKYSIFLFGNVCGLYYIRKKQDVPIKHSTSLGLVLLSVAAISLILCTLFKNELVYAGALSPLYFVFILSLFNTRPGIINFFSWKPFIVLGEISYGMYILQCPVQLFFSHFFLHSSKFVSVASFFLYTVVLIVISLIGYYCYEIPFKNLILKKYKAFFLARQAKTEATKYTA